MYNQKLHFHFTGIGGTGMSGIAEILLATGFEVSGSDQKWSSVCSRLQEKGAEIIVGHAAENIPESASLLVFSSAVTSDNPEVVEARKRGIPVVRRAEVLAELMRMKFGVAVAGSHGKTSTTSMLASIMEVAELDPTVIIGGIVKSIGTGGKLGNSNFLIAESDESDRSFLLLKPTVAIVTNIDKEHLHAYESLEDLDRSFEQFVESVPFYGLAVLCIDDTKVRDLAERYTRRKVTYGISPDADIRAQNIELDERRTSYDVVMNGEVCFRVNLPLPGRHLMVNSLAAIAVALEFGISYEQIKFGLESFQGVGRRLELIGDVAGVKVIDDYGHHPTEVRATIQAIRDAYRNNLNRLHVIFQPHRYSRTRDCFVDFLQAFREADRVIITDIYAASEQPLEGVTAESLVNAMNHPDVTYIPTLDDGRARLVESVKAGDVVICLGAGTIGGLAQQLVEDLENHFGQEIKRASLAN